MVVRRNDRRRRVKSDDYGLTVYQDEPDNDQATVQPESDVNRTGRSVKRTYASAADRRNQLRTTDLFPKRTWLTSTFGLLLVSMIVSLNGLAWIAPAWAETTGQASVASLTLGGAGTLTQFFIVLTMLLSAAVSMQIYVLRKHRCDDYCGAYRIWKWIPPLFVVASLAAVVDVRPAAQGILLAATGQAITLSAPVPVILISLAMAVLFFRMLFEVRESRATIATFVLSWIAISVAVIIQAKPVAQSIAASDQSLLVYNSIMLAAASLLVGHLFYARFVYLHAHGLIAQRTRKPKKQKLKIAKTKAGRSNASKPIKSSKRAAAVASNETEDVTATTAKAKQPPRKSSRRKAKQAAPAKVVVQGVANQSTANDSTRTASGASVKPVSDSPTTMASFQALLASKKQSAANAKSGSQASGAPASGALPASNTQIVDQDDAPAVVSMTKAQKRKARKDKRSQKRAA